MEVAQDLEIHSRNDRVQMCDAFVIAAHVLAPCSLVIAIDTSGCQIARKCKNEHDHPPPRQADLDDGIALPRSPVVADGRFRGGGWSFSW